MKLVNLKPEGKVVVVGDTHGDFEATNKVIKKYLKPGYKIIFLGDYVDRGDKSRENIAFLLKLKKKHPKKIYLLQGNHEAFNTLKFSPADFWESLGSKERENYSKKFEKLLLAVSIDNVIMLHGAPPNIKDIRDINKIKNKDKRWFAVLWGDLHEIKADVLNNEIFNIRPLFGSIYFNKTMKKLNKKVLIRSHQPDANLVMFNKRCLTIFSSKYYGRERVIAILDFTKKKSINSTDDIKIERI